MYNGDNKAMVSPNSNDPTQLSADTLTQGYGDGGYGEEDTELQDILRMKEETVKTLRSLDGVLAGMFALSEQRTVASEMS